MYQNLHLWMIKLSVLNKHYCELLIVKRTNSPNLSFGKWISHVVWLVVENTPSLLLALARLVGAATGFPQQRRAENADDAQVEDETDDQHPDGSQ